MSPPNPPAPALATWSGPPWTSSPTWRAPAALPHTRRAYASDLAAFRAYYDGPLPGLTVDVLRGYFDTLSGSAPATRARKQAASASFLSWAYGQDPFDADPMGRVERVQLEYPAPRGVGRESVEGILRAIPRKEARPPALPGDVRDGAARGGPGSRPGRGVHSRAGEGRPGPHRAPRRPRPHRATARLPERNRTQA